MKERGTQRHSLRATLLRIGNTLTTPEHKRSNVHFPGDVFRNDAPIARGARRIAPTAAAAVLQSQKQWGVVWARGGCCLLAILFCVGVV